MYHALALLSATLYGAADFLGGVASRRASTLAIVALSQVTGLVLLGMLVPLVPGGLPAPPDLVWGATAGLAGGAGVALLYRALAVGTMSVVAPVTAVCAVALPVVVSILLGERPHPRTIAGILLALIAIVLVSQADASPGDANTPKKGVGLALASGVAIGFFYLALARASADTGLWPLIAARTTSVGVFALAALGAGRRVWEMAPRVALIAVVGGVLDVLANVLYLLATRRGPLSVVVTLSSLYPASTVLLARAVLGERLNGRQTIGLVCAFIAVALIVSN